jgi:alpha-tubulin suppressor-like RCC1 family protein
LWFHLFQAAAGDDFTAVVSQDERVFLWGSNGYPSPFEKSYFQGKHPRQVSTQKHPPFFRPIVMIILF